MTLTINSNRITYILLLMIVLVTGLVISGCSSTEPTAIVKPTPTRAKPTLTSVVSNVESGMLAYNTTCVACHGPNGIGIKDLGKDWTESDFIKNTSDEDLMAFIKAGRPATHEDNTTGVDMPAMGGNTALTDQDLADIIAYARSINK